jgi:hypothetical protein
VSRLRFLGAVTIVGGGVIFAASIGNESGAAAVSKAVLADGSYTITNACNAKPLGLQNGNPSPWDNAVLRDAGTSGAITWQITAVGDGSYIVGAGGTQSVLQTAYVA